MTVELAGIPKLKLKYSDPNITPNKVGIQSAQWEGRATVKVKGEAGKTFRIGFVQILEKNTMMAIYQKTKKLEVLIGGASLPVLDGTKNLGYRPFYDKAPNTKDVVVAQAAPPNSEQSVDTTMWDEPESSYKWFHNNDPTDALTEFIMFLQFSTYVAVRDISNGIGLPILLQPLYQWHVVLDRRYKFDVAPAALGGGVLGADLTNTSWTVENPQRTPFVQKVESMQAPPNAIMTGLVANQVFKDDVQPTGKVTVGESIKSL